ncbi:BF3164 family lipoprotein [Sphingobacterium sp. UT-1RO-CII-1]|uniref:BF3164 family lipoprotein n=1 Tax=Sphingobacterium sp. UT-1RO-CII-1 TaxID=2995225 RepID=UPI00227B0721|nr:BF3164 family lipoprotein [Sphingobacterium sp. UT-1RO-CII-1]MCY4778297.1 BF3164 family lipoprotein [Sphingobacterium sp. UT-1RO-CII-1]
MKKTAFFISICIILTSCQRIKQDPNNYEYLKTIDSLTFFTGLPVEMKFYKDYIFIYDFFGENGLISVINPAKDTLLFSFLHKGNGPDEIISFSNLDILSYNNKNLFGVFDNNTKRYRLYNSDSIIINYQNSPLLFEGNVKIPYSITELFKINKGYIATGFFPDGKFALLDDDLNLKSYNEKYRPKTKTNIDPLVHAKANIGKSVISSDLRSLANVTFHAGILEYYNIENDSIIKEWEFVLDELDYTIENELQIRNNQVEGFISVDITQDYIFALYSGKEYDHEAIATYGKYVYQFDRNGNLLHCYQLDREVLDIKVKANRLKAIVHYPEPMIVSYLLPM